MQLDTLTMDHKEAREKFLEYRRAVRERHDDELAAIMRGYREMSLGRQLIHLSNTVRAGGASDHHHPWRSALCRLPNLAVMRADHRECWVEVYDRGDAVFLPHPHYQGRRDRVRVPSAIEGALHVHSFRAMVPPVPPALRPKRHLRNYHVLWEAEWAYKAPPRPPGDPALLKRIAGDLFVVLATWDLTPLEKAVLSGREA